jgi:hypothetical protein
MIMPATIESAIRNAAPMEVVTDGPAIKRKRTSRPSANGKRPRAWRQKPASPIHAAKAVSEVSS